MNLIVRLRNKTWLLTAVPVFVSAIYNILALFGVVPPIAESAAIQALTTIINLLAVLGVVIDPTTAGLGDSARAMTYQYPYSDTPKAQK